MDLYFYKAKVIDIYDGDSITILVDLGFSITVKKKVRLYGIDTPELRGTEREDGLKALNYLKSLVLNKDVIVQTYKDKTGKYGRLLATIYLDEININEKLVNENYAMPYIL